MLLSSLARAGAGPAGPGAPARALRAPPSATTASPAARLRLRNRTTQRPLSFTRKPRRDPPPTPTPAFFTSPPHARFLTHEANPPNPPPRRPKTFLWNLAAAAGIFGLTTSALIAAFFIYDFSTYRTSAFTEDLYLPSEALNPPRGGKKNLPILTYQLGDYDSEEKAAEAGGQRPRLVLLGSGWGSVAVLKTLRAGDYHVTLVSPDNYFLFTPLLPSAAAGTLGLKCLVEPVRVVLDRIHGHYLKARAVDVDVEGRLVEVAARVGRDGEEKHFYVPYDKLVIGVGCDSNPHGVKGLEHVSALKTIDDARKIKRKVLHNLELAALPTTPDAERRRLLSFVVCGGGPTGVEFAAELYDMLNEDLPARFPKVLRNEISIHVIQSRGHILNTYDETLSEYAEEHLRHDQLDICTNSRVKEVAEDRIYFSQRDEEGKEVVKEIPCGFVLWSTGVAQNPFVKHLTTTLPAQHNVRALKTDAHLRLLGAPHIYALGDCSTVENNVAATVTRALISHIRHSNSIPPTTPDSAIESNIHLTYEEWVRLAHRLRRDVPQAGPHLSHLSELFQEYDADHNGTLEVGELKTLLARIDSKMTSLPATAQRANQQGLYLGRKLNRLANLGVAWGDQGDEPVDDEEVFPKFKFKSLGSLAYIGNAAVFDLPGSQKLAGGLLAVYLWRSVYFAQTVSLRTRVMLATEWAERAMFGRDMMSF